MKPVLHKGIMSVGALLAARTLFAQGYEAGIQNAEQQLSSAASTGMELAKTVASKKTACAVAACLHMPVWVPVLLVVSIAVLVFFCRRPKLDGLSAEDVIARLGRLPAFRWRSEELEIYARACNELGYLNSEVTLKLSEDRLDELLNFLYVEKSHRLFCEVLFCKQSVYKLVQSRTGIDRGEIHWLQIADFPVTLVAELWSVLRTEPRSNLHFQFINSFCRQQAATGAREKAMAVLDSLPVESFHQTNWETLLDICGGPAKIPSKYFDHLPKQLCSRVVLSLVDEGNITSARLLLERVPRSKWTEDDNLAYFAVQLQTDMEMANEFYSVLAGSFPLRSSPELHYSAALRYEAKGRSDMALDIYRRFVSEGVNHKDAGERYSKLRASFSLERRTMTILMTDIKGYTARSSTSTPQEMMEYLQKHHEMLRPIITREQGRVVKSIGDSFLAVFANPSAALRCATAIQLALFNYNAGKSARDAIHVRVIVHLGEVSVAPDGDIYGDAVNITSRIEGIAEADQVWFTEAVSLAVSKTEFPSIPLGPRELKDIEKPVNLFRLA